MNTYHPRVISIELNDSDVLGSYIVGYCIKQQKKGAKIILITNLVDKNLKDLLINCADEGLAFDAINKNLPETAHLAKKGAIYADSRLVGDSKMEV